MKNMIIKTASTAMLLLSAKAIALTPVDVELQLLVDISGSISTSEYNLQLQGYENAFASDNVQDAIINGSIGQIAVQMIMWSGRFNQRVVIDWTLVDSDYSADSLSAAIGNIARPFSGWTAIGTAIEYGYPLFDSNSFDGTAQVIDISGDGTNNSGSSPGTASSNALANGVDTINGIVITDDQDVIDQYYNNVIGGDSPFLLAPATFSDFQTAIENKIIAEIEGTKPNNVITIPEPSSWALYALSLAIFASRNQFIKEK